MGEFHQLPKGVGPHEGKELELMLKGEKPLVMFNHDWPKDLPHPKDTFSKYVEKGMLIAHKETYLSKATKERLVHYYFTLPEEAWRIQEMVKINHILYTEGASTTAKIEFEIGKLLGYSDKDIETYLKHTEQISNSPKA